MKRRLYICYLLLLVFVVAAYSKVALMQHPLMWDAAQAFFPWRYFISECVRNGHLPLWNPYQVCGYPFLADPQSGAWYPLALIAGLAGRYSVYIFQLEYVLTVFIGGVGMFRLINSFVSGRGPAMFGALCFAACGFFVSNAEHTAWVAAAAWLPWLLWAYHHMLLTGKYGYAMLAAVFLWVLLCGGYPAFLIVVCYIMLGIFTGSLIIAKTSRNRLQLVKTHAVFGIAFLLLAGAILCCFAQSAQYITRGNGITLQKANGLPFSPQSMLSLLLPFASIKNDALFVTDVSMRNAYFSITGLVLLLAACAMPGSRRARVVLGIAVLCLLISFGAALPLRKWLYDYVPLMNLFRFPSLFRLFFIIGAVVVAATAFQKIITDPQRYRGLLSVIIIALISVLGGGLAYELHKYGLAGNYKLMLHGMSRFLDQSLFYQHVIVQSVIQITLLLLLLFMVRWRNGRYLGARSLLLLCAMDLVIATQLNAYGTIVSPIASSEEYKPTNALPTGYAVPDNTTPIIANNDYNLTTEMAPLPSNLNIYKKRVAVDGYGPFVLSNYERLDENKPLHDSVWRNPYLYLSYSIAPIKDSMTLPLKTTAAVAGDVYEQLKNTPLQQTATDQIAVSRFEPGTVTATVRNGQAAILVLQQSSYPGWKVWADGRLLDYFPTAYANISVLLPPGTHHVVYAFEPAYLYPLLAVSMGALLCIVAGLIWFRKRLL